MAKKKLIYVAGPFRGKNNWDIECNIRRAEELALEVWRTPGCAALCPHTSTRFFQGAAPDDVWLDGTLEMLRRCDGVVLTEFWERSSGARTEVRESINLGIPVYGNAGDLAIDRRLNPAWLLAIVDASPSAINLNPS